MGDLQQASWLRRRIFYKCLISLLLSTAAAHTGRNGRRHLFTPNLEPSNSSISSSTSPAATADTSRSMLPPATAPPLMAPLSSPPQRNGSGETSASAAQQAGVSADMPGASLGAPAPSVPAPAPVPASGPPPTPPINWGNNPFATPSPTNAPFNPTPMFNTILITGVGIAAVLVCVIGCMVSMRFVRFGQLPTPAPASRRQRQDEAEGTGGAKMEPSGVPMRRAVLVHNPDDEICCGVELTPTAGHPMDEPMPQEDAKASSSSGDEPGDTEGHHHGESLSEIELR